jgi:ribosomal protein L34E
MKPVAASTIVADLQALGLDPKNLPALSKLEPDKLRKVMRTFTKSLGARCADCHIESDFAASTPMKKIAQGHWDEYVRKLSTETGAPVYCDSCHQARLKLLDRTDKKALGTWMDANFVDHFKRRDGKEHGCETCHGDPFEGLANARFLK